MRPGIKGILDFERLIRLCFSGSSLLLITGGTGGGLASVFVAFFLMLRSYVDGCCLYKEGMYRGGLMLGF